MAQWTNSRMEQRSHSKELGETAVAVVSATVPTAAVSTVESAVGTGETTEKADPKIAAAKQIKSLPLSQLAVPYQHPPS